MPPFAARMAVLHHPKSTQFDPSVNKVLPTFSAVAGAALQTVRQCSFSALDSMKITSPLQPSLSRTGLLVVMILFLLLVTRLRRKALHSRFAYGNLAHFRGPDEASLDFWQNLRRRLGHWKRAGTSVPKVKTLVEPATFACPPVSGVPCSGSCFCIAYFNQIRVIAFEQR